MTLTLTQIADVVRANVHPDQLNELKVHPCGCVTYTMDGMYRYWCTVTTATTIGRSDTALGAFYRRLSSRIGKQKAVTARKIAVLFYNTLRFGMSYHDPGAAAYEERHRTRVLANLQRRAKTLGFTLAPMPDAEAVS